MTIGDRIKARRDELGMSQTDLADKVGITKQNLYKYENSIITNIPIANLELIAKALGTSPASLMGWAEKEEEAAADDNGPLTEEEASMLERFRSCDPERRAAIMALLKSE